MNFQSVTIKYRYILFYFLSASCGRERSKTNTWVEQKGLYSSKFLSDWDLNPHGDEMRGLKSGTFQLSQTCMVFIKN